MRCDWIVRGGSESLSPSPKCPNRASQLTLRLSSSRSHCPSCLAHATELLLLCFQCAPGQRPAQEGDRCLGQLGGSRGQLHGRLSSPLRRQVLVVSPTGRWLRWLRWLRRHPGLRGAQMALSLCHAPEPCHQLCQSVMRLWELWGQVGCCLEEPSGVAESATLKGSARLLVDGVRLRGAWE